MSMKNSNDTIGNRTRDLQTWSAEPRPTEYNEDMNNNSEKINQRETIVRIQENKEAKQLRREFIVYECSENVSAKRMRNKPSTQKTVQDSN
jgi:hypothetical protein